MRTLCSVGLILAGIFALVPDAVRAAAYEVVFDGKPAVVQEARVSAMPFNRVWPGYQRSRDQTRISHFVSFDVPEGGGELRVVASAAKTARIRPFSRAQPVLKDGAWAVRVDGPEQFVLEFGGTELHVFADPPWTYKPVANERYFGPGEHDAGAIVPKSGETVTLDRGAVVYGNLVILDATNVTVRGRGVLCGSKLKRVDPDYAGAQAIAAKGWTNLAAWGTTPVCAKNCRNLKIGGIVFRDAARWTMNIMSTEGIDIDNVKLVGMWRYNSDGIDICGSRDIRIRNSFVRSFDDCVVARPPCRDMTVENCVLWCDWGMNLKVQHSEKPSVMENIVFRDIKAVHVDAVLAGVTTRWGSDNSVIRDVRFENIEADAPPERVAQLFQKSDDAVFTAKKPSALRLLSVDAYSLGKIAPNQGKPGPMDENFFHIRYENLVAENFKVYRAPRVVSEGDDLGYPVTVSLATVVPGHEIRGVALRDFPKALKIARHATKGRIRDVRLDGAGAGEEFRWSGGELHRKAWVHQCVAVPTEEGVRYDSKGLDPFVTIPGFTIGKPSNLHEVVFRAKCTASGLGELFYSRPGDRAAPQSLAQPFQWIGDGKWHTYRVRPYWAGQPKIVSLRLDMPADPSVQTTIDYLAIEYGGADMPYLGTAVPGVGAAFTVPPQDRTVWANIEWIGEQTGYVRVPEHLHLIGDGKARRYFFDAKSCVSWNANYPRPNQRDKWRGRINLFRVINAKTGLEVPIEDLEICKARPGLPPELILSHTHRALELDRAGRDVDVEVGLFNVGTLPARGVTCTITGLPPEVTLADPARAGRVCELPGGASALHTVKLRAAKPCAFTVRLTFAGGGIPSATAEVPVKIGPSLGLPQDLPYIPEPKPLKGKYEVGAFYFLDWARTHHWLKVWRTTPERRPAAGWYRNDNPELLDWQIKWAVENGISYYLLDWYVSEGYFQKAIKKARFAKYIKWAAMWCNHIPAPLCDEAHWTGVIERCLNDLFKQPQYMYVNGMPYFSVWDGNGLERDNGKGGCKRMLEKARAMARAKGYKGIYFQAQCGSNPADVKRMAEMGFDETTTYHFIDGLGRDRVPRKRAFADVVDASYPYWKRMLGVGGIGFLPNLSTGWDDRPWHDGFEVTDRTVADFRRLCREARRFADETGTRRFCLAPLQEWGEGSYADPNAEFGFGMFEAVRDAFFEKPAEGWALNYTPADIGRGPYPVEDEDGGPAKPFGGHYWR